MDKMTESLNRVIDEIQQEWGADKTLIWMRSHHRTGCLYAWRVLIKDSPINCFAVMSNGEVHRGRHDNLVGLFSGPGDVAVGAKKKFHDKY